MATEYGFALVGDYRDKGKIYIDGTETREFTIDHTIHPLNNCYFTARDDGNGVWLDFYFDTGGEIEHLHDVRIVPTNDTVDYGDEEYVVSILEMYTRNRFYFFSGWTDIITEQKYQLSIIDTGLHLYTYEFRFTIDKGVCALEYPIIFYALDVSTGERHKVYEDLTNRNRFFAWDSEYGPDRFKPSDHIWQNHQSSYFIDRGSTEPVRLSPAANVFYEMSELTRVLMTCASTSPHPPLPISISGKYSR